MNVQITHIIVHEPAQAREIIREADAIASEFCDANLTYESAFNAAVQLLGQRYTFAAAPNPMALPSMAIPGLNGRR